VGVNVKFGDNEADKRQDDVEPDEVRELGEAGFEILPPLTHYVVRNNFAETAVDVAEEGGEYIVHISLSSSQSARIPTQV
jgi:fatty acid-binding protein DegV